MGWRGRGDYTVSRFLRCLFCECPWDVTHPLSPKMSLPFHAASTEAAIYVATRPLHAAYFRIPVLFPLSQPWRLQGPTGFPQLSCVSVKVRAKNWPSVPFLPLLLCPGFQNYKTQEQKMIFFFFSSSFLQPPFLKAQKTRIYENTQGDWATNPFTSFSLFEDIVMWHFSLQGLRQSQLA